MSMVTMEATEIIYHFQQLTHEYTANPNFLTGAKRSSETVNSSTEAEAFLKKHELAIEDFIHKLSLCYFDNKDETTLLFNSLSDDLKFALMFRIELVATCFHEHKGTEYIISDISSQFLIDFLINYWREFSREEVSPLVI